MEFPGNGLEEKILTFQVGSGTYGVPLDWVFGIECRKEGEEETDVHVFRGRRLKVIDMGKFFGGVGSSGRSLLVLGRNEAEAAVLVDRPGTVVTSPEVYKLPDLCQSFVTDTFRGVFVYEEALTLMVDPERICREGGGEGKRVAGGGDGI